MKKIILASLALSLIFSLASCGGKKDAYEKFTGLVDKGQIIEAYDYWQTEGEEIFGDSNYKDIANYREYVNALGLYLAGEPVRLSLKIAALNDLPSDFLDTKEYIEEMDDLLDDMCCEFTDPTEERYGNKAKLEFDGEEFEFSMGSLGDEGVVDWAVKEGKIICGTGRGERMGYTFTFTDSGVEVSSDNEHSLYAGTYYE